MELLVLGTFVGVLAIFLGLYWLLVVRGEGRAQGRLRGRLKGAFTMMAVRRFGLTRPEERLSNLAALNALLVKAAVTAPITRLLEQAGSNLTVGLVLLMSGTAAAAGYLIAVAFSGWRIAGVLAAILLSAAPFVYLRIMRARRLAQFEEKFPEAIDLIARALRAGHAFTTGVGMVADELPDPVGTQFRLLYDRQNFGMPLQEALRDFAARVPILDARFFATAVLTQREAGGNLSEVLDNLSRVVRERFKVKRQVKVSSAHARLTGMILVALPPVTATAFLFVVPETMRLLVEDPLGIRLVIVAIVLQIMGGLIVRKLVNIEY